MASRSGRSARRLPDAADDEDVVVGAKRQQEHDGGERDVIGDVVVA
jgi:hypothetical protein